MEIKERRLTEAEISDIQNTAMEITQAYGDLFMGELVEFVNESKDLDRKTRILIAGRVVNGLTNSYARFAEDRVNKILSKLELSASND